MKIFNIYLIVIMILHTIHGTKKDIVVVLDRSGSLSSDDMDDAIDFIYNVTSYLNIGSNDIQLSLVSYSNDVRTEFQFTDYLTKNDLLIAINNLTGLETFGSTYTFDALDHVRENIFTSAAGARTDADKTVIVMTDGASNDLVRTTASANNMRRDVSAKIFAIAIGQDPDSDEVNVIADDPDDYYVHSVSDFLYLCNLVPAIVPKLDNNAAASLANDCPTDPEATTASQSTTTTTEAEASPLDNTKSSSILIAVFAAVLGLLFVALLLLCCYCFMLKKKKGKQKEKAIDAYMQVEFTPTQAIEGKPLRRELSIISNNGWTKGMNKDNTSTYNLNRESTDSLSSVLYRDMFQFKPKPYTDDYV